jgi:hypothetical protein
MDISDFASPQRLKYLRRRPDGKVDLLDIQEGGQGGPLVSESVLSDESAKEAARQGYRWVDDNMHSATVAKYRRASPPEGRTPFFLGDKAEHQVSSPKKTSPLDDALSWAAGMGRVPPEQTPQVEVGEPLVISRTPSSEPPPARTAPGRPSLQLELAGRTSSADVQHHRQGMRPQPLRPMSALQSVYEVDPEVGDYLASMDDDELRRAQERSRNMLLAARITRAGAMGNEAISGARYDRSAMDGLEAGARQPVADVLERRKAMAARSAEAREAAEMGLRRSEFNRRGAADARDFAYRQERDREQTALERDRMGLQERMRADDREARRADRALTREEMRLRMKLGEDEKREAQERKRQDMLERQNERDLQELAKRSQDAAQMKADLEILNRHLSNEDIPGVGPIVSALPELFLSSDGTELRQAATRLYRMKVRLESGQTVTPQEAATALEARGMGPGRSETAFRKGMESLRNEAATALRNIEAGFHPSVVRTRREYGGTTSSDMPRTAPTRTGRYKRGRDGKVYAEMSDGSAVEVR